MRKAAGASRVAMGGSENALCRSKHVGGAGGGGEAMEKRGDPLLLGRGSHCPEAGSDTEFRPGHRSLTATPTAFSDLCWAGPLTLKTGDILIVV